MSRATRLARPGRPSGGRRPRGRARARRGSVTVMAGVFMVVLTMFSAVAIDATRVFSARSEMQTIVDAAALAGAIQMLRDSSVAEDSARAYATSNGYRRGSDEGNSSGDALLTWTGVWEVGQRRFIEGGDPADAIRVAMWRRVPFLLAQMVGGSGLQLEVRATAWSAAPVGSSNDCMKPIMLPFSYVRDLVNAPSSQLTQDDMRRLRELTQSERTGTFAYGNDGVPTDDQYLAVSLPPIVRSGGRQRENPQGNYQQYLGQCMTTNVAPDDWLLILPGNHRQQTVNGVRDLCETAAASGGMGGTFSDGSCFVGGVQTGIPMKVVFWDSQPVYGTGNIGAVQVKMLGSFVLTHIDNRAEPGTGNLARATITGYLTTTRDHGPVAETPSTLRRAVIVE